MAKSKLPNVDGLGPKDIARITKALRKVWSWSYARRLVDKRCTQADGFKYCEKCHTKCPKFFVDHIEAVGSFSARLYIERLFLPSHMMQGLCGKCHTLKTKQDMKKIKASVSKLDTEYDFY